MATTNLRDTGKGPGYFSWLLRLWRVVTAGNTEWRASLENPHTGEQRGFADLDELLDFLREQAPKSQERSQMDRQPRMPSARINGKEEGPM